MISQKSGRIINLGSTVGVVGTPFAGAYSGSKAAVEMISRASRCIVLVWLSHLCLLDDRIFAARVGAI